MRATCFLKVLADGPQPRRNFWQIDNAYPEAIKMAELEIDFGLEFNLKRGDYLNIVDGLSVEIWSVEYNIIERKMMYYTRITYRSIETAVTQLQNIMYILKQENIENRVRVYYDPIASSLGVNKIFGNDTGEKKDESEII